MRLTRLSPLGVLAPNGEGWREQLREAMGDDGYVIARELAESLVEKKADRDAVLALAAACLSTSQGGSTRIPIGTAEEGPLARTLEALDVPSRVLARAFELLGDDQVVGGASDYRPLLVDAGALCMQRMLAQELDLCGRFRARLARKPAAWDAPKVKAALEELAARAPVLGGTAIELSQEQRRAIVASAHQSLTVISGGPGTGKTSIVVSILRLLLRLGVPVSSIALAAPTGKAANRMEESVVKYLEGIAHRSAEDDLLLTQRPVPTTLHRLLGYSPSKDRFRHHAQNPLAASVVIVDEASMIDLALMSQLLRAVGPEAKLVLLGDAEQLPSVDAGAVLRDLVPVDLAPPARPWDALVGTQGGAAGEDLRAEGAVRLTRSYRMNEDNPEGRSVYLVSQSVRAGEVPPVVDLPQATAHLRARATVKDVAFSGVELLSGEETTKAFAARWFTDRLASAPGFFEAIGRTWPLGEAGFAAAEQQALADLDREYQRARVLCLTRRKTEQLNERLTTLLREAAWGGEGRRDAPLAGTPVMMTHNDYQLGLFNGDQGLVLWVARPEEDAPRLRYVFRVKGAFEVYEPGALGSQVLACWAMTVHKAQGSEFDHVALVLPTDAERERPDAGTSLACREVVYTAMTRARRSVTVLGSPEALGEAVERSLERWSALSDPSKWVR